ncbi:MAG: hypothetical protein GQ562_05235 [Anaerolineales bacterium]|jgi:hypothetical protein|nr:hypothetical protein [Anaerolineales bacterium]
MKKDQSRLIWGGILILAGILFLLQELNILGNAFQYLWLILMAAGGGVFIWIYFTKKEQWWAIIPGLTLLGLSLSGLDSLLNFYPGSSWTGAVFLGCIGLAFWLIYLRRQDQWWAIIPGGVLLTLAAVAGLEKILDWSEVIFFLGLACTFALVGILPNQQDTRWAFIPAAVLAVLGVALFAPFKSAMLLIWPVALIALGVYILFRNWK